MKKNITINLFGALYAIDEDAYELLKRYEENMRCYFRRKEGGEEISADIEYRVAELFSELKASGVEAINIGHVEEIIRRIGNPEQMDASDDGTEDGQSAAANATEGAAGDTDTTGAAHRGAGYLWRRFLKRIGRRRFYRDPQDKIVAGVMSGLCRFFGGDDPLPWRIALVLLFFASFTTVAIIYLALWALVPQARTAEDRLRMKGQHVSVETISEEVVSDAKKDEEDAPVSLKANGTGCFTGLFRLLGTLFKGALFLLACMLLFSLLSALAVFGYIMIFNAVNLGPWSRPITEFQGILQYIPGGYGLCWVFVVALLVALFIMVCAFGRWVTASGRAPLSPRRRLTAWLSWLIAAGVALVAGILFVAMAESAQQKHYRAENTRRNIYLTDWSWRALDAERWRVVRAEHCMPYVAREEQDNETAGTYTVYSFYPERDTTHMQATLERTDDVPEGIYRIDALMSGARDGATIYLGSGPAKARRAACVMNDLAGWATAQSSQSPLQRRWPRDEDNQPQPGYDYLVIDSIHHPGGPLTYGVSNDIRLTGRSWTGQSFSLRGITLQRVADLPAAERIGPAAATGSHK